MHEPAGIAWTRSFAPCVDASKDHVCKTANPVVAACLEGPKLYKQDHRAEKIADDPADDVPRGARPLSSERFSEGLGNLRNNPDSSLLTSHGRVASVYIAKIDLIVFNTRPSDERELAEASSAQFVAFNCR